MKKIHAELALRHIHERTILPYKKKKNKEEK